MSPYEVDLHQKPRKPTQLKLGSTTDELGICKQPDNSACRTQPTNTHLEKQFSRPKDCKVAKRNIRKMVHR